MDIQSLHAIAKRLVEPKKGILAADESNGTANKRFAALGIPETEEMRRKYRQMLFETPGIEKFVTGVILYDETIRQNDDSGKPFRQVLEEKKIMPGIKVDMGLQPLPNSEQETFTTGLDGLPGRLMEYRELGAKFAKWRAAFKITATLPTDDAIKENCEILAKYARMCQEEGIMPMVEPEVLLDGPHSIERAKEVTTKVLNTLFEELSNHFVDLKGLILKTSMVLSGNENESRADAKTVGQYTVDVLKATVPEEVTGVVFLSGGQTPEEATDNLREIAKLETASMGSCVFILTCASARCDESLDGTRLKCS